MTRTSSYIRSSCDTKSENSLEDQLRRCREIAQRFGLTIDEQLIFSDSALSGTDVAFNKREGYHRFLQAWDNNEFDNFIVDEFSRLSRDAVEQALIMRRLERNRRVRMLTADGIDTADSDWQLRLGLQGVLAQQEIRKIQHRVGRGMVGQLERGYMIAPPVFGYDLKREFDDIGNRIGTRWVINETKSAIVKEVFARRETGQSMHQIAAWLNTSGVPCSRPAQTPGGGFWRPSRVRVMLVNPIYKGEFVWHGSNSYQWQANKEGKPIETCVYLRPELRLVSDETWTPCESKSLCHSEYGSGKHALAGLINCGCCGGTLAVTSAGKATARSLYCPGCAVAKSANGEQHRQTVTVATAGMEILLKHALLHFLTPAFIEALRTSLRLRLTGDIRQEIEAAKARLAQLRSSQERLSRMLADITDDDPVLAQRYAETRQKVADAQSRLAAMEERYVAVNAQAIDAQFLVYPAELLEGLFDAEVPLVRLRTMLSRLFPSIVFQGKSGRYISNFRIRFAPGTALAMASNTESVVEDSVVRRFVLRYKPDYLLGNNARWSVAALEDDEQPIPVG